MFRKNRGSTRNQSEQQNNSNATALDFDKTLERLKSEFINCDDYEERHFLLGNTNTRAVLVFLACFTDTKTIKQNVLRSLMDDNSGYTDFYNIKNRIVHLGTASFLGLYGLFLAFLVLISHLAGLKSFGVNYLSLRPSHFRDTVIRSRPKGIVQIPTPDTGDKDRSYTQVKSGRK